MLSELLGIDGFREKSAGLSRTHLVQQGAELAYLLLHDPEYRRVRREHLVEVGKRVRLKENLSLLARLLGETMSLQYLEALTSIGASPATKFVLPMELTGLLRPFTRYAEQATAEKR